MSRRTIVINLIGGPGVGKSTLAAGVFVALKLKGYVVEYVQEFAKQLVWTKQFSRLNNQHYVSTKQYEILKQINGAVDFIITDGPLLHGLYYNLFNPDNTSDKDKTNAWILKCASEFRNINIFLQRGNFDYESEGRIQTEREAKEIDIVLQHLLRQNMIHFDIFDSSVEEANLSRIVDHIIAQLTENKSD